MPESVVSSQVPAPPLIVHLLILFTLLPAGLAALPADADPSFPPGGTVLTEVAGKSVSARSAAVMDDGRLVVAGYVAAAGSLDPEGFLIARYLPAGTLDAGFGSGGIVTVSFAGSGEARCVSVFPDGRIVAAGTAGPPSNPDFALVRLLPDGMPDPAFGAAGRVLTAVSPYADAITSMTIQSDGKIVVAGTRSDSSGGNDDFVLARYLSGGVIDQTFSGGIVISSPGVLRDAPEAVLVQPDGAILAAGVSQNASGNDFAVIRCTPSGAPDASFSGDGVLVIASAEDDAASSALLQADGRIVLAGHSFTAAGAQFAAARLLPDGSPDHSFGNAGRIVADIGPGNDFGRCVAVQNDGKIIMGGYSQITGGADFSILRILHDGTPDPSFNGTGRRLISPAPGFNSVEDVILLEDGRILAAGFSDEFFISRIGLALLSGDPAPVFTLEDPAGIPLRSGSTISAGATLAAGSGTEFAVRIRNTGRASLERFAAIVTSGGGGNDFEVITTVPGSLLPAEDIQIIIRFRPSLPGTFSAQLSFESNDQSESPFSLRLEGTGLSRMAEWRRQHFGSPAETGTAVHTADPDSDSLPNLLEYASGTDPNQPDGTLLEIRSHGNQLILRWYRDPLSATEVLLTPEQSQSLEGAWSPVAGIPSEAGNDGGPTVMLLTVPLQEGAGFFRLKAEGRRT